MDQGMQAASAASNLDLEGHSSQAAGFDISCFHRAGHPDPPRPAGASTGTPDI